MKKTGSRDENIDFWRNWRTLGFVAKFLRNLHFLTNGK